MLAKKIYWNRPHTFTCLLLSMSVLAVSPGCDQFAPPKKAAGISSSPATGAAPAATGAESGELPAELIQAVEKLVQLNEKYCEVAKQVQDAATFRQHADELSQIEQEASSATEDIMIAENKLSASQKDKLDREHFHPKAKPSIDKKNQEKQRVLGYVGG